MADEKLLFDLEGGRLPYSVEAEQATLGSIIIDPKCFTQIASLLKPDYFYIPQLYPLDKITHRTNCYGEYYLDDTFFSPFSLSLIEAEFSRNDTDQARIYVTTGYYDENESWIARPELLTKTYEKLARRARKLAQKII